MPKRKADSDVESDSDGEQNENSVSDNEYDDNVEEDNQNQDNEADSMDWGHSKSEAEIGIIEEVTLINFMCHKHLNLKFGPNINFLVGQNGSGKSAVLVAITIGLGAKAGFTSRASKLSDFIRGSSNSCTITIRLRNRGSEAFKIEEYGDSIIVERKISREGGSAYKIKDHTGKKVIATTASELHAMLEQFNIQINNPVAILMQETSKQFLSTAKPKDKYKFFLMATQLDQMERDFTNIKDQMTLLRGMLDQKQQSLPDMQKDLKEFEREYEEMQEYRSLEGRLEKLKEQVAWAQVIEAERIVEQYQHELGKITSELEKLKNAEGKLKEKKEKIDTDINNRRELCNKAADKLDSVKQKAEKIQRQLLDMKKELTNRQNKVKDKVTRQETLKKRIERVQRELDDIKRKNSKETGDEVEKRKQQILHKQTEIDKIKSLMNEDARRRQELDDEMNKSTEKYDRVRNDEEQHRRSRENVIRNIKALEQRKSNAMQVYGDKIPILLDAIRKSRFRGPPPLGPVGMLIRVKEDRWATAIETAMQNRNLRAFIVTNDEDQALLQKIANQVGCSVPTNIQKEDRYDIPQSSLPDSRYLTMLNIIETDHYLIRNFLVDQISFENKILVETTDEARDIMFVNQPPRNVREAYTLDGSRFFVSNGAKNAIGGLNQRKFISVDIEHNKRELESQLPKIEKEIQEAYEEKRNLEKLRNDIKQQADKIRNTMNRQQTRVNTLEKEIKELESIREEEPVDTSEMEESIKKLEEEIEENKKQKIEAENSVQEYTIQLGPLENELNERKFQLDSEASEVEKLNEQLQSSLTELRDTLTTIRNCESRMNDCQVKIDRTNAILAEKEQRVETLISKNAELGFTERVQVEKSGSQLDKELSQLQIRLQQEKGTRDFDQIEKKYKEAKERYKVILKQIKKVENRISRVEDNLRERVKRWTGFRSAIARRTKLIFNANLSQKGFSGTIDFDHSQKTLNISIQLDKMRPITQQHMIKDTKSLSGGERSYSTVSLLLALWEAMECPFRAMDEFDVFMDPVNRQISLDLLIESAREHKHRQFIFITPHDYSGIKYGPDVRVHKMHPPERGQSQIVMSQDD